MNHPCDLCGHKTAYDCVLECSCCCFRPEETIKDDLPNETK